MNNKREESELEIRPELEEKLSELEILRQSVEEAKTKEKQAFDQLLRLTAEFQNFRTRSETRVIEARKAGREDVMIPILSLCDALIHAELSIREAKDAAALKKGISLVLGQFEKFLADQ